MNYRAWLDQMYSQHPELFPQAMKEGYRLHDVLPESKKLAGIRLRRIELKANDEVYTVRPSCILPYMSGYTDDVEKGLLLLGIGVPHWIVTRLFGRNDMYWERLCESIGHNSLVGTTVRRAEMPQDLLADEKHTTLTGEAVYIATTVGGECVLGAAVSPSAGETDLLAAYTPFQQEARNHTPTYQPATVNLDGWKATCNVWISLFPTITVIFCFLHAFLKIHDRCKGLKKTYFDIAQRVWQVYQAPTAANFHAKLADLAIWALNTLPDGPPLQSILKLCLKFDLFATAYEFPNAHRTSNMVDRHMRLLDHFLFSSHSFHGHLMTAEFRIRAWALLHNFMPFCPRVAKEIPFTSRAHRLNGFVYHDNWVHNLLISSSMAGFRA
jgi:hypothetical protein